MTNISYSTVMSVENSWNTLKKTKNYEDRAGALIFERMFELEPAATNSCPVA